MRDLAMSAIMVPWLLASLKRPWLGILKRALRMTRTRIGVAIVALIVLVALLGPLVAPYSPTEFVAIT